MGCYLDNAATTPLSQKMKQHLISLLDVYGNPSSTYSLGNQSKKIVDYSRNQVANFINAENAEQIYFTSSGSASNTLGIMGFILSNKCEVFFSPTAHKSIIKTIDNILEKPYYIQSKKIAVNNCGEINLSILSVLLRNCTHRPFVIVEYANSEIGTIQRINEISQIVHKNNGVLLVDCTGSISTIPLDVKGCNIDIATFSAHKLGALKGIGVLYKKDEINLKPLIFGSQEKGLFAGTENILGIASLEKAIELHSYDVIFGRDYVWNKLKHIENMHLIGLPVSDKNRLANNLYICVDGVKGQDLVSLMDDLYDIQISTGSACNNGDVIPSNVLQVINIDRKLINNCIRIVFSGDETIEELNDFCKKLLMSIKMLKK